MKYDKQRAGLLKRIPAWILDAVLMITLATGLLALFTEVFHTSDHYAKLDGIYKKYEAEYDIKFGITHEEYQALTAEQKAVYDAAEQALQKDAEVGNAYMAAMNSTLGSLSLSILGAYLVLEFLIPMWLKNGQTIGKKVFGVALMRKDGVKVTPFMMLVRTVLGKYTVETMLPIFMFLGAVFGVMGWEMTFLALAVILATFIVTLATRDKTSFHDLMACTIAVDLSSQMIFDSPEAQLEYHKKLHEEIASKADY